MALVLHAGAPSAPVATAPGHAALGVAQPVSGLAAADTVQQVKLNDTLVSRLAVGKVYRDHKASINGLDFTYDGQHLVTSGEDSNTYIYDCEKAQRTKNLRCEKYGVGLVRFLHNDKDSVLATSRNLTDHVLKYWDLHDNKYIRLFRSHNGAVNSISPHPYEDTFISGSEDRTMMLWDLRQDRPLAKIQGHGSTFATFDQQGLVFAACVGHPKLHLFDTRNYAKGEFSSFDLATHLRQDPVIQNVQFSPCGKYLLVRTKKQLMLVDAFDGEPICEYPISKSIREGVEPDAADAPTPVPGFSPDSQYVISGVPGGDICIWSTTNARLVHRLQGHTQTPGHVMFSPTSALIITAAETLAWWIPDSKAS